MLQGSKEIFFQNCTFNNKFEEELPILRKCSLTHFTFIECKISPEQTTKLVENYLTNVDVFRQLETVEIPNLSGESLVLLSEQMVQVSYKYEKMIKNGIQVHESGEFGIRFEGYTQGPDLVVKKGSEGIKITYTHQDGRFSSILSGEKIEPGETASWTVRATTKFPERNPYIYNSFGVASPGIKLVGAGCFCDQREGAGYYTTRGGEFWAGDHCIRKCNDFTADFGDTFHITVDRAEGFFRVCINGDEDNIQTFYDEVFKGDGELRPIMSFYNEGDEIEIIND